MKNFPTLRDWIDDLAEHDLLTIAKPGLSLNFELAALAHRLDGEKATFFPAPSGHASQLSVGSCPIDPGLPEPWGWMKKES